ncbi:family 16 glycosylhydrolase [Kineococcus sp. T13]|uniref:family 16 glycosylhydrolase n=1 Tax=Kineococcus vitellinus TaxID=2696565 RepID=UPI0014129641|nr:family 16 glycosylhydrolase [Kineococcus vitellinus]NAZ73868.1 family 16 glycosylhydrolase [Kineococcus vitellinus]
MRRDENYNVDVPEGQFLQTYGSSHSTYPENYLTTHGGPYGVNNGDHYGGNTNLSVVNGRFTGRLHRDPSTGLVVAMAPEPLLEDGTKSQLYGRYEVLGYQAVYPLVAGWTTAWLMWPKSEVWPRDGEIDWMEGQLVSGAPHFNHHNQDGTGPGDQQVFSYPVNVNDGLTHNIVLEWKPNDCAVFVDGQLVGRATSRVPNTPMRCALQTETLQSGTQPPAGDATQIIKWDSVGVWGLAA